MNYKDSILLPGLDRQLHFLLQNVDISSLNILVLGSGTAKIAKSMMKKNNRVEVIVDEYESLIVTNFELKGDKNITPKLMDYESTDFADNEFDLVYAQGSISNTRRKNIVKEIKRICQNDGYICIGEIVKLSKGIPRFVQDIFDQSDLDPIYLAELNKYYTDRNLGVLDSVDLSLSLKEYYERNIKLLKTSTPSMNKSEMSYYKKVLNQISHQSNAYLKLGGDKFIGFKVLLLRNL